MGDHPIVWKKCVGEGRSFYSAIGHRAESYADATYLALLENGIVGAAERARARDCKSSGERLAAQRDRN